MTTYRDVLAQAKREIREASSEEVKDRLEQPAPPVLIDIREPDETDQGIIPGAVVIPRGFLEMRIEDKVPERDQPVVLYCAGGSRSALAAKAMQELGYTDVTSMSGGFSGWKERGFKFNVCLLYTSDAADE